MTEKAQRVKCEAVEDKVIRQTDKTKIKGEASPQETKRELCKC